MHPLIENNRAEILALAARHGVRNVRVFGSMARGDADDTSDVDLLVSLPPDRTGLALGALLMDVQDLLHRRVEVVTERGLHPALRDRILREARPLWRRRSSRAGRRATDSPLCLGRRSMLRPFAKRLFPRSSEPLPLQ